MSVLLFLQNTSTLVSLTGPLSVDKHLKIVRDSTWEVRAQWYHLGVGLGINVGTLKVSFHSLDCNVSVEKLSMIELELFIYFQAIERDCYRQTEDCVTRLLEEWLTKMDCPH